MQLLHYQCQLLHFEILKTELLGEIQDESLKVTLKLCSDEKTVEV